MRICTSSCLKVAIILGLLSLSLGVAAVPVQLKGVTLTQTERDALTISEGLPGQRKGITHADGSAYSLVEARKIAPRLDEIKTSIKADNQKISRLDLLFNSLAILQREVDAGSVGTLTITEGTTAAKDLGHYEIPDYNAEAKVPVVAQSTLVKPVVKRQELVVHTPVAIAPVANHQKQIALWVESNAQDNGHIEWVTPAMCEHKEKYVKNAPLFVSDFTSSTEALNFEALRTTGKLTKDNSNVASYMPKGSLIAKTGVSSKDYQQVMVISTGTFDSSDAHGKISVPMEQGYIYKDSIGELRDYLVTLETSAYLNSIKAQGLNLDNVVLKTINNEKNEYKTLDCCANGECNSFLLFNIIRQNDTGDATATSTDAPDEVIGFSPTYLNILKTATAQIDEDSGDEGDNSPATGQSNPVQDLISKVNIQLNPNTTDPGADQPTVGKPDSASIGGVPVVSGNHETVICFEEGTAGVRSQNLTKVLFSLKAADSGTAVKVIQGFKNSKQTKKVDGKTLTYINIHVEGKGDGWVQEYLVKDKSLCKLKSDSNQKNDGKKDDAKKDETKNDNGGGTSVQTGGYIFPTLGRPRFSYVRGGPGSGQKWFGGRRNNGHRVHAGCDLYRPRGENLRAVGHGRIIRGAYHFFGKHCKRCAQAYAVEQQLDDKRIIRYGETATSGNARVGEISRGQHIGTVSFTAQLHYEMYSGRGNPNQGLTVMPACKGRGCRPTYERRSDLINPTSFLRNLEKATFGSSY